jgi:ketosteroid isomerase-like protein
MTRTRIAFALLGAGLAGSLGGCQQQQKPPPPPDTGKVAVEVEADARKVVADYNAKDPAQAASHDAEGYVGLYAGSPNTVGADADRTSMEQQMKDPALHFGLTGQETTTVSRSGDMAVFESGYTFTTTDPSSGNPATENGTWVAIYRRQAGGSMKLWRSILIAGPKADAPQV